MTDKRLVLTTAASQQEAHKIAHALIERRLAACVNIIAPAHSVYRWQGKVETADEWLLLIKTTAGMFSALREALRELHSYEVPECIAINIEEGSEDYLNWIGESVAGSTE
jgi:periplasmic divalent cation tolerance protein